MLANRSIDLQSTTKHDEHLSVAQGILSHLYSCVADNSLEMCHVYAGSQFAKQIQFVGP